jgi:hypothetical protein
VLNKIHDTPYKELPTPNTLNKWKDFLKLLK